MEKIYRIISSRSKNFWMFLVYLMVHSTGRSVSAIFIPIILLKLGYTLTEVIAYYILFYGFNIIANFVAKKFIVKFGVKQSFFLATITLVVFFATYLNLSMGDWPLLATMAVLAATYDAFFYVARNYSIIDSSEKKENLKKNNIVMGIMERVASFLGPVVGAGIIIFSENEKAILMVTIFVLLLSFIPLFGYQRRESIKDDRIDLKKDLIENKSRRSDYIDVSLFRFSETAEGIIWPIYIYLFFGNLESVAALSVLVVFISIFLTYLTVLIPQEKRHQYIVWGALGLILVWGLRYLFDNEILFYLTSIFTGAFALFIKTPIDESILIRGKENVPIVSAFYRNAFGMAISFIFFIIIFIVLQYVQLKDSFLVIIMSLMCLAVVNYINLRRKRKRK